MAPERAVPDPPRRIEPGPGQESVWDYPRPPRLEDVPDLVVVTHAGVEIARSTRTRRVLETSQPPVHYVTPDDVALAHLIPSTQRTFCEWKGTASYFDVVVGDRVAPAAAWSYADPTPPFAPIAGWFAFYAQLLDRCELGGEVVAPNPGAFYGGWVTSRVVGPFKGGPGSAGW